LRAKTVGIDSQLNLFTKSVVAVDGSKFKAVNTRDKNFTVAKVAKRIEQVEPSVARYLGPRWTTPTGSTTPCPRRRQPVSRRRSKARVGRCNP